jgi:phosphoribosylaminoimidazole-succinocarboxamide synthase
MTVKMGSVKDLTVQKAPAENKSGIGRFIFSDRYSVFDWGEMPDLIKNKGASLCLTSAYFFDKIAKRGIKSHYLGLLENGALKNLDELKGPAVNMEIRLLQVIKPEVKDTGYDYSAYQKERSNFLIPLEVIYRNSLPEGSSIFKRLKEGDLKPEDLGLKEMPVPGQVLEKPWLDVSTKLEANDRYLCWEEAKELAGLTSTEVDQIKHTTLLINEIITKEASRVGLTHEDGKVEFGFDAARTLIVVDTIGTLDECRFTLAGFPVSKEITRVFYRNTSWYREAEEAKKRDRLAWRDKVISHPPQLPPKLKDLISLLYAAWANEITQRTWFNDTPPLQEILPKIKQITAGVDLK